MQLGIALFENSIWNVNVARIAVFKNSAVSVQPENKGTVAIHKLITKFPALLVFTDEPIISNLQQLTGSPFNVKI